MVQTRSVLKVVILFGRCKATPYRFAIPQAIITKTIAFMFLGDLESPMQEKETLIDTLCFVFMMRLTIYIPVQNFYCMKNCE
jgi:hypothetical protein